MKFIKNSKYWFSVSAVLLALSLTAMVVSVVKHGSILKYGIDFTGGTLIEIQLDDSSITSRDIRETLKDYKDEYSLTVQPAEDSIFILKLKSISNETHDEMLTIVGEELGTFEEARFITIGSTVGKTMKKKAFTALAIALIAIVLYIAYAFQEIPKELNSWKFGFSAIIALIHDVTITMGVFAFLGITIGVEVDLLFVTALLTVMGFSVHDTIVTFDRLRENVKHASRSETLAEIGERSIKQTLRRSINTSISTLFPLIALSIFGVDEIRMFIFALIIGIVVGTYSSIFLATPILIAWQGSNQKDLSMDD